MNVMNLNNNKTRAALFNLFAKFKKIKTILEK